MNTSVANVILIFLSIILYSINEKFNSQNICKNIKFVFKYQKKYVDKESEGEFFAEDSSSKWQRGFRFLQF